MKPQEDLRVPSHRLPEFRRPPIQQHFLAGIFAADASLIVEFFVPQFDIVKLKTRGLRQNPWVESVVFQLRSG
ncbi:MAG: hypothetical protein WD066_18605, partial [Planctomycetaceae bacterium]